MNRGKLLVTLATLWFLGVLIRTAWQCDDAYITFRTVENFWHGHGLVWNPGERVQSYTSPLWMGVALLCRGMSGEVYFSTLAASIALTLTWLLIVAMVLGKSSPWAALAILALSASSAVTDYATSGLENPLLALWLVLLTVEGCRLRERPSILRTALLTSALALTRLDAILFALPWLGSMVWRQRPRRSVLAPLALGFLPLLIWEGFSLIYYGSLVPNTAHAKLNLELALSDLVSQGLRYFVDSWTHDPITLTLVFLAIAAVPNHAFRLALVLVLTYVSRIGGDFMSGRFFVAPAVLGAALLVHWLTDRWPLTTSARRVGFAGACLVVLLVGSVRERSPWRAGPSYGEGLPREEVVRASGIADERAYYYPFTGLLRVIAGQEDREHRELPLPPYPAAILGQQFAASSKRVKVMNEVGFFGYFAGPEKTVIDAWALCDPLLARLPFRPQGPWRIGHYPRPIPAGYQPTLASGEDRFVDQDLGAFYRALQLVTRGPLFTGERWLEIWRLHTGHYEEVLQR